MAAELVAHQALLLAELFAQRFRFTYLPLLLPHQEKGTVWAKSAVIISKRELSLRWWRVLCVGGCVFVFMCVCICERGRESVSVGGRNTVALFQNLVSCLTVYCLHKHPDGNKTS